MWLFDTVTKAGATIYTGLLQALLASSSYFHRINLMHIDGVCTKVFHFFYAIVKTLNIFSFSLLV